MLEEYKNYEPIIYRQMKKALDNNLSHAYLFDMNQNIYAEKMVLTFVKSILCKEHKDIAEYNCCDICRKIDEDNYQDLKKIVAEGQVIKKEQLDELQKKFSTKSLENDKRIYIIYDAEKLNLSAANSLLKFLEEPSEGIIAILLTNNINQILKTIVSRCQILNFSKNKVQDFIDINNINTEVTIYKLAFTVFGISEKENITDYHKDFVINVIKFIKNYENNGIKSILYEKENFLDVFKEKHEILFFFECVILFYKDVINNKLQRPLNYYDDYIELINTICKKNEINKLLRKINVLMNKQKLIKNNLNINMLLDSMFIDMEV